MLQEIYATGGDGRKVSDLLGIGIESTTRYLSTMVYPSLREEIPQR